VAGVENEMRSIGEMARDSGLSVSALRFYDGAGVLAPASVDPVSGYRRYAPDQLGEARLLARLRRTGMPLADVRLALAGWSAADTDLVHRLLRAHLRRLERGLADARSEFSEVRALLTNREHPMTPPETTTVRTTTDARSLAAALDAVRFAAGTDPELPMLGGVLFDIEGGTLHAVATDRYRLAVAGTATTGHAGRRVQATVPTPLADAMRALLHEGTAHLTLDGDDVTLETPVGRTTGTRLAHDFPDYRRLTRLPEGRRAHAARLALRAAVETGPTRTTEDHDRDGNPVPVTLLRVTPDDTVAVCAPEDPDYHAAVNRQYLLDALAAAPHPDLTFQFGPRTAPLAIRAATGEGAYSLLMPVRLEG
jgi:DNA-binding transcriptional MerR regulator